MASSLTISPCQPAIGAEIGGVDLTKPLPPETVEALRAALLRYQVIVLRDQDITREQHKAFALIFARNREQPFTTYPHQLHPIEGYPEILHVFADGITKTAVDIWHTDDSYKEKPATVSILRAKIVPSLGGDTVFSSAVAAYAGLPEDVKQRIHYLKAYHAQGYSRKNKDHSGGGLFDKGKRDRPDVLSPPVAQPVVRIHPETGLPVLYVNEGLSGEIIGLAKDEDEKLRAFLYDQIKKPDYQMRVRWRPHTIVVWDNRSVQHYAIGDYKEPRVMERIAVSGDAPCLGFADLERGAPLNPLSNGL